MINKILFVSLLICAGVFAQTIHSPNGKLTLKFTLSSEGEPTYEFMFWTETNYQNK